MVCGTVRAQLQCMVCSVSQAPRTILIYRARERNQQGHSGGNRNIDRLCSRAGGLPNVAANATHAARAACEFKCELAVAPRPACATFGHVTVYAI
jgi:hypothetical protein